MEEKVFKSGYVTLIGQPNVGKSTLMNHLIGQKIAITSAKPQTTRNRIQTVYTDERGQIIFVDTPGLHRAKYRLDEYMQSAAKGVWNSVDLICWLVEPRTEVRDGERRIAADLSGVKAPVVLVINKVDKTEKEKIMEVIAAYRGLLPFAEIVPVSALKGTGVDDLRDTIFRYLPEGPQYYDEDTVTEQPMREIAGEIIREKALRLLSDEVPHGIAVTIEEMKQRENGLWNIEASIICEKDSHKGIVIGKGGSMLKKIGTAARMDIEEMTGDRVNLKLFVKVRKDWRDSELFMKSFGYDRKTLS